MLFEQDTLRQDFCRILRQDRDPGLSNHVAFIHAFRDPVHRTTGFPVPGIDGALMRI